MLNKVDDLHQLRLGISKNIVDLLASLIADGLTEEEGRELIKKLNGRVKNMAPIAYRGRHLRRHTSGIIAVANKNAQAISTAACPVPATTALTVNATAYRTMRRPCRYVTHGCQCQRTVTAQTNSGRSTWQLR